MPIASASSHSWHASRSQRSARLRTRPIAVLDAQGLGSTAGSVPLQPGLAGAHAWFQTVEVAGAAARLSNAARIGIAP